MKLSALRKALTLATIAIAISPGMAFANPQIQPNAKTSHDSPTLIDEYLNTSEILQTIEDISRSKNPVEFYNSLPQNERIAIDEYMTVAYSEDYFTIFSPHRTSTVSEFPHGIPATTDDSSSTLSTFFRTCWVGSATSNGYNSFNARVRTVTVEGRWCMLRKRVVSAEVINHHAATFLPGTTYAFTSSGANVSDIVGTKRANMVANYSFSIVWNGLLTQGLCARLHGYIDGITSQDNSCSVI